MPITAVLYLTLIPAHGATGAAIGSTISYALTGVISFVFFVTGSNVCFVITRAVTFAAFAGVSGLVKSSYTYRRKTPDERYVPST